MPSLLNRRQQILRHGTRPEHDFRAGLHAGSEREAGATDAVVLRQLDAVLGVLGADAARIVVAYEPVWAIGTGRTATPDQAQAVHATLRARLTRAGAGDIALLYGGSVKADNAAALFGRPDIDGGLIGGASLKAADFLGIARA